MRVPDIPRNHIAPDVLYAPKGQFVTKQRQGDRYLVIEQGCEEVQKHPLLIWTNLSPGDVVSLRGPGIQDCAGTVEARTSDGLRIWIRDDLNERRLFHFRECQFVCVIR